MSNIESEKVISVLRRKFYELHVASTREMQPATRPPDIVFGGALTSVGIISEGR
jgi:hypothetical protein